MWWNSFGSVRVGQDRLSLCNVFKAQREHELAVVMSSCLSVLGGIHNPKSGGLGSIGEQVYNSVHFFNTAQVTFATLFINRIIILDWKILWLSVGVLCKKHLQKAR